MHWSLERYYSQYLIDWFKGDPPIKKTYKAVTRLSIWQLRTFEVLASLVSSLPKAILVLVSGFGFKGKVFAAHGFKHLESTDGRSGAPQYSTFHSRASEVTHPESLPKHLSDAQAGTAEKLLSFVGSIIPIMPNNINFNFQNIYKRETKYQATLMPAASRIPNSHWNRW